jgi:putative RNA 2'-phosphotransferase
MASAGHVFYRSQNGVWLTDAVPVAYIDFAPAAAEHWPPPS